jgi:hypothetical protein
MCEACAKDNENILLKNGGHKHMINTKQFASYRTNTRYLENAVGNYEMWYLVDII